MRGWVVLAACGPGEPDRAYVDAAVDTVDACVDVDYVWAELDASAPSGSLDSFHYAYAFKACGYVFAAFRDQPQCPSPGGTQLSLGFHSLLPPNAGDVIPAVAFIPGREDTGQVTFTVHSFVTPPVGEFTELPSFAGRFVVTEPGWRLDINVDMTAQYDTSCL